ncbi:unnamed protein product [Boreogadus saida]
MLYNFIRKPTLAVLYKGETLKRLLDQRWTGHLATVKVVVKSFHDISTLLTEVENTQSLGAEIADRRSVYPKTLAKIEKFQLLLKLPNLAT